MEYEIKELGIGGILDHSLNLIKNNFGMLLAISGISLLIVLLTFGVWGFVSGFINMQDMAYAGNLPATFFVWLIGGIILLCLVYTTAYGAVITYLSKKYLGEIISLKSAFGAGFKTVLPLIWVGILFFLTIMLVFAIGAGIGFVIEMMLPRDLKIISLIGPILAAVVIVLLYFRWGLVGPIVIIERLRGVKALKRSTFLMKKNKRKLVVILLIFALLSVLLEFTALLFSNIFALLTVKIISQLLNFFLATTTLTVLYFSTRCQKESFDLQMLADDMNATDDAGGMR